MIISQASRQVSWKVVCSKRLIPMSAPNSIEFSELPQSTHERTEFLSPGPGGVRGTSKPNIADFEVCNRLR
ncbi:hypothetical protein M413DRAFT_445978 [Hebeloma cylindrosporum]|uniref:Uncharacterized protein n=1 Tax=Hebeloma cylindrosporum TaxID=76867 RepID=A0A0C3CAA1_HEBCY|nr:hypothetical protein M413DRAFT_445978 [Hebeloma cylindrosporum h7]